MQYTKIQRHYWRSDENIVSDGHVLRGADPKTFRFLIFPWGCDNKKIWFQTRHLRRADPGTFRALNALYGVDAQHAFAGNRLIAGADVNSFVALDSGMENDLGTIGPPQHAGYAQDKMRVYWNGSPVKRADPETFQSINQGFGRDSRRVFCCGFTLQGADPFSWYRIGSSYSSDSKHVYFMHRLVPDADVERFELIDPPDGRFAYDCNNFYVNGVAVSRAEYLTDARRVHEGALGILGFVESGGWEELRRKEKWYYDGPFCTH